MRDEQIPSVTANAAPRAELSRTRDRTGSRPAALPMLDWPADLFSLFRIDIAEEAEFRLA